MAERAAQSKPPATYQDILDAPPQLVAEIVAGELHLSPRPAFLHANASSVIGMDIGGAFQRGRGGPGGWWIVDEPELHFDDHVLVPDLAGWRKEHLAELPTGPFTTVPPDWVCEVLSPSTARWDRVKKVPVYAGAGVAWLWLVDPRARTLEVLQLEGKTYRLLETFGSNEMVRVPPFDAIELELGALWIGPDEATPTPA